MCTNNVVSEVYTVYIVGHFLGFYFRFGEPQNENLDRGYYDDVLKAYSENTRPDNENLTQRKFNPTKMSCCTVSLWLCGQYKFVLSLSLCVCVCTDAAINGQFKPVAASSPNQQRQVRTGRIPRPSPLTRFTPSRTTPLARATPPSPVPSEESTASLPEDLVRYRSPQKLQIVKPMEGSMTLLKWKLLATPQLGGAKSFFSTQSGPGVHLKKWPASQIQDRHGDDEIAMATTPYNSRMAVSAMDLRELNYTYPPAVRRPKATPTRRPPPSREQQSQSLLGQVGSFLGSGLSRLKFKQTEESPSPPATVEAADAGLGGLL